jgi:hypothetical protein
MKPTSTSVFVFLMSLLLLCAWTTRTVTTLSLQQPFAAPTSSSFVIGPAVQVVTEAIPDGARTRHVTWSPTYAFAYVALCLSIAALASWLLPQRTALRRLLIITGVTLLLTGAGATLFCLQYWGYPFRRPSVEAVVRECKKATHISGVTCTLGPPVPRCSTSAARPIGEIVASCDREPYDCLTGRIPSVLYRSRRLSEPVDTAPPLLVIRALEHWLATTSLLARAAPGYRADTLSGVLVVGRALDGSDLAMVGLGSPEISNDHPRIL